MTYRISVKASEDIEGILRYGIAQFGERAALEYVEELKQAFGMLCEFRDLGRLDADLMMEDVHRFEVRQHTVFYEKEVHGIFVLRVLHVSMEPARHVSERYEDGIV